MLESAFAQPLQDWALRGQALIQQGVIDVVSFFSLGRQGVCLTQVGLVSEHNEEFRLLAIGSVFHHPRRNLVRRGESVPWRTRRSRYRPRLSRSRGTKRKQNNHDSRETKQNAK